MYQVAFSVAYRQLYVKILVVRLDSLKVLLYVLNTGNDSTVYCTLFCLQQYVCMVRAHTHVAEYFTATKVLGGASGLSIEQDSRRLNHFIIWLRYSWWRRTKLTHIIEPQ